MAAWGCDHPGGEAYVLCQSVGLSRAIRNGSRARIDFLEGLTTQQSFVALGRALNEKLGSCSITAMNDLVLFDESDGLSVEQKRKLVKALGSRLDSAEALSTIFRVSVT